jgi:hypothetical protein
MFFLNSRGLSESGNSSFVRSFAWFSFMKVTSRTGMEFVLTASAPWKRMKKGQVVKTLPLFGKTLENGQLVRRRMFLFFQVVEDFCSFEKGRCVQFVFDAEQLVVLADPVGAAEGAGLDLPGVDSHGEVGQGSVLGFS